MKCVSKSKKRKLRRTQIVLQCFTLLMIAALLTIISPRQASAADTNYYVAATGSDMTGNGSIGSPWATIQKARDYIRTNNLNANMTGNIIVNVAAGDYYITDTITFTDTDSGSNGYSHTSPSRPNI